MKAIQETKNQHHWPRHAVKTVECRKRDLVIRIADWMSDKEEPAYDVEVYIGGVYDWEESEVITRRHWTKDGEVLRSKDETKRLAIAYAQAQIEKLL